MSVTVDSAGFRYIPGPFQYSAGVAALPGFAIHRIRFANPVLLQEGFARIEAFLGAEGLPLSAFCACELRSPEPFTDEGFIAFNRIYVGTLTRWGIMTGDANPVARSNVCPELHKPAAPSFHAFSIAVPSPDAPRSFVIAGSGESLEGAGPYKDKTVRYGETSPDAMAEKMRYVMGQMEKRMAALGRGLVDGDCDAGVYRARYPSEFCGRYRPAGCGAAWRGLAFLPPAGGGAGVRDGLPVRACGAGVG